MSSAAPASDLDVVLDGAVEQAAIDTPKDRMVKPINKNLFSSRFRFL